MASGLLVLFVGSGCAALIYEIVWFQMLELFVGSSSVSIGVLLGTFMGGMCLGSFLLPRFISPRHHPLKVYALLEIAIGVIGLLLLVRAAARRPRVHRVGRIRRHRVSAPRARRERVSAAADPRDGRDAAGGRAMGANDAGRRVVAGVLLRRQHRGAVMGTLLAGFYLLRVYDMNVATYVAAVFNFGVGGLGLLLAAKTARDSGSETNLQSLIPNPESPVPSPQAIARPYTWRSRCPASARSRRRSSGRAS